MPTLNELKYTMYSEQTGLTGLALPELERYWLYDMMGEQSDLALPSLWMEFLSQEGYTQGTLPERLFYYFDDLGHTGTLIEKWYKYAADRGGWWLPLYGNDVALAIDFANERTYNGGVQSTPTDLLTYTAPSPKMVYGADGLLGYAPHNLQVYSNDFANAAWTKNGSSVAAEGTAPDGSTATKLTNSTSNSTHGIYDALTLNAPYSLSVYMKAGTAQFGGISSLSNSNCCAVFDLSDGTVDGSVGATATITSVGDGWYRCSITPTSISSTYFVVSVVETSGIAAWTAYIGTTKNIYIWNTQANSGPTALTYIPTTSAARYSIPLDHDPVTLEPLGVLVEEQRTNLLTYSEQFDNAAWTKTACAVTANAATAPDGTTTADLLTNTSSGSNHHVTAAIATVGLVAHGASVYVKRGNNASVKVEAFGTAFSPTYANITYNFDTDTLTETTGTAERELLSDGWVRITAKFTASNTGCLVRLRAGSENGTDDATVYLWGAQLEAGASPTSYIPTVASQVTRAADAISLLTSAFPYNAAEGTLLASVTDVSSISALSYMAVLSNGNTSEFMGIRYASSNPIALVIDNSVTQVTLDAGTVVFGAAKFMVALKAADFAASYKGGAAAVAASGSMPTPTTLYIGSSNGAAAFLNGHIKSLAYWPTRKPNAYLQEVTA